MARRNRRNRLMRRNTALLALAAAAAVGAVVTVLVVVVGLGSGNSSGAGPRPTVSPATARPSSSPSVTVSPTAASSPAVSSFGRPVALPAGAGTLTVDPPQVAAALGGDPSGPTSTLVTFEVTFRATRAGLVYNPLDFRVRDAAGQLHDIVVGGRQPELDTGTLAAGGTETGYLTADAPAHGILSYVPSGTHPVATWRY